MSETRSGSWVLIGGREDSELEASLRARMDERIALGRLSAEEEKVVQKAEHDPFPFGGIKDRVVLERIRSLCQTFDVQFEELPISSHRKFIGPVIVFCKKLILRSVKPITAQILRKQTDFNANAIMALSSMASYYENKKD